MFDNSGGFGFSASFVDRASVFVESLAELTYPKPLELEPPSL